MKALLEKQFCSKKKKNSSTIVALRHFPQCVMQKKLDTTGSAQRIKCFHLTISDTHTVVDDTVEVKAEYQWYDKGKENSSAHEPS